MILKQYNTIATAIIIGISAICTSAQTNSTTTSATDYATELAKINRLDESDYEAVATELGIEVAVIKTVSDIEAGKSHKGFVAPGKPLLNFSRSSFQRNLTKAGIHISKSTRRHNEAFHRLNQKKYGSYGKAQYARYEAALAIDSVAAIKSCYWGMYQIGGFNWKRCGCQTPQQFAALMSQSERAQLELFAHFIANNGNMLQNLANKKWYAFARAYNGAHAKRYARRMASVYKKYKAD